MILFSTCTSGQLVSQNPQRDNGRTRHRVVQWPEWDWKIIIMCPVNMDHDMDLDSNTMQYPAVLNDTRRCDGNDCRSACLQFQHHADGQLHCWLVVSLSFFSTITQGQLPKMNLLLILAKLQGLKQLFSWQGCECFPQTLKLTDS